MLCCVSGLEEYEHRIARESPEFAVYSMLPMKSTVQQVVPLYSESICVLLRFRWHLMKLWRSTEATSAPPPLAFCEPSSFEIIAGSFSFT